MEQSIVLCSMAFLNGQHLRGDLPDHDISWVNYRLKVSAGSCLFVQHGIDQNVVAALGIFSNGGIKGTRADQ